MRRRPPIAPLLLTLVATSVASAQRYGADRNSAVPDAPERFDAATPIEQAEGPRTASGDFATRITALELALASTVSGPPAGWRLDALIAEAGELAGLAADDAQRRSARAVSTRLEEFAEIARRAQLPATPDSRPIGAGESDRTVGRDAWRRPNGRPGDDPLASRTQPATTRTTGVLRPVVSKRPGAPSFAVVNADGQIAAFVTPKAEIKPKLDALVGRRVSLSGSGDYRLDVPTRPMIADRRASGGRQLR